jgi:hypothetical protein
MDRIERHIGRPADLRNSQLIIYRFLDVLDFVPGDDPATKQQFVAVMALIAGRKFPGRAGAGTFGLGCTSHAIARLLDRSGFTADPIASMLTAHDALLALEKTEGKQVFDLKELVLPASGGIRLARPRLGVSDKGEPLLVCRSWVPEDLLHHHQEDALARWAELVGA